MPVKTIFVDRGGESFWVDVDGFLIWEDAGSVRRVPVSSGDLAEFSEWLAAEVAKRKEPEAQEPWDAYPVAEWIEYDGSGECPVPCNWIIAVKLRDGGTSGPSSCTDWIWGPRPDDSGGEITHFKIISKD